MTMKNLTKTIFSISHKLIFIFSLLLLIQSCKSDENETELSKESILELEKIIGSKEISFQKEKNTYRLVVKNTNLKSTLSKKMGASNSAIILYSEVVKNNPTLIYETEFVINYFGTSHNFIYKLDEISNAINAQEIVDSTITKMKNKTLINFDCSNNITNENLKNWSKIEDYGFLGFSRQKELYCNENKNITLWRTFISPDNVQLWFYIDNKSNKLLNIIQK
jgi:hypothetical protein